MHIGRGLMVAIASAAVLAAAPAMAQQQAACTPPAHGDASARFKQQAPNLPVSKSAAEKALYETAAALGMVRLGNQALVADVINAVEISATGTWNEQKADKITIGWDAILPAVRIDIQRGNQREVLVGSGKLAWDESKPGVFSKVATEAAADRYKEMYLMPWGAVFAGVKAPTQVKVSDQGGVRQITVPTPLGNEVKLTLDQQCFVSRSEMTYGGKLYTAEFSDYVDDAMEYDFYFPKRITIKADGKLVADLTVSKLPDEPSPVNQKLTIPGGNAVFANPYVIFPVPAPLK